MTELLRIFLCHSSQDKQKVRDLCAKLLSDSFDVWLDENKLLPGQEWEQEIPKAVRNSHIVIVCLSKKSISKEGYVQKEIKFALDVSDEKPDGAIFLIPMRLDDCEVPDRLRKWQWVDFFEVNGYEKLKNSLSLKMLSLGLNKFTAQVDSVQTIPKGDVPNLIDAQKVSETKNDETNLIVAQKAMETTDNGEKIRDALIAYSGLIRKGKLLDKVIHDLQIEANSHPTQIGLWQTLGDAYMRAGRLKEALTAYNEAQRLIR
ncbi:MAG: TIR domain-containing protein [bacterium]|nr:TIR domain-containing protein [bacterium]